MGIDWDGRTNLLPLTPVFEMNGMMKMYSSVFILKKHHPLHRLCSLCGFTKINGKHANMEVIVKSNDFPGEETQSFSLGRTKPTVVA